MTRTAISTALVVALALSGTATFAQTQRSGGSETQKIVQQYQALAAEKTALQAQVAQLQKDLDASKSELVAVKKDRDALKKNQAGVSPAALAQANAARGTAEQNLEQSKLRMNELVSRFRDTATQLKQTEIDRDKVQRTLAERNEAFDKCAENNFQLYEVNNEILDRYEHIGPFTKASSVEPFTRLTRTRIENLVDDYRARAQELKVKKIASK